MAAPVIDSEFPHTLTIHIPLPSERLAAAAQRTLSVDEELSALVKRSITLVSTSPDSTTTLQHDPLKASLLVNAAPTDSVHSGPTTTDTTSAPQNTSTEPERRILQVHYRATTPRMLRVAVNGFFESLMVVVQVMEELDADVLHEKGIEGLEGVQGVEQGMTGEVAGVAA